MIAPLLPDWPAPPRVRALVTTRAGGVSAGHYASLNLATHVGDEPAAVAANRHRLLATCALPAAPRWLNQVHGTAVIEAAASGLELPTADAAFTTRRGVVCAVLTADCLPILLCDRAGTTVAAVHAGWRGLSAGVIAAALTKLPPAADLLAWVGPGIGPQHYQVGAELRAQFLALDPAHAAAFSQRAGAWYADLAQLAVRQLEQAGVGGVYTSGLCTYANSTDFFSFRRNPVCGRIASLIWIV